jgi:signal transduction histidine kinase
LNPVSLPDLASGLIEHYFSRDRQRLVVTIEGGDEEVMVDEARLILLLKNLLGNALRYSRPEDGAVELTLVRRADELEIRVRDHGPGIPPEQIVHLGEPFFRGDPSRTRGTGGSGLGLYLSKLVAEAHGGKLRLREDIRDGACFEVVLPLAPRIAAVRRAVDA